MALNRLGEKAKKSLIEFVDQMDGRLENYWNSEMAKNFGFNETQKELVKKMLLHAKEHNLGSAKRLRASFVYYSYKLSETKTQGIKESLLRSSSYEGQAKSQDDERIWQAAEAIELVHTALLMHDDFMDRDKVRRGLPTTQEFFAEGDSHYGESMAVSIGDTVLCLGFERLLTCGFETEKVKKATTQLLRGITNTAYGQAYDVSLPKLGEITEEKVMSLHRAKTAIYTYENPLFIGAILAGLSEKVLNVLHDYAIDGGIAFQLQDDILGVYGDEEKTGKSADSDLLQGKVTLLIVKTLEKGTEEQKENLLKVWGKLSSTQEEIDLAKKAIKESGAYEASVKTARVLANKAADGITVLREWGLNSEAADFLEGIARYMVEREV